MKENTKIFINLPVKNLDTAKAFYTALGGTVNPQFSNEQGALHCYVGDYIPDAAYTSFLQILY